MSEDLHTDDEFNAYIAKIKQEDKEQKDKDEEYRKEQYASLQKPFKMTSEIKRIMSK